MTAFYNEIDAYAAQWLRNLIAAGHIAPGVVDERSIVDLDPDELRGYTQCHFFAGIGGWSAALRLAGWSDDRPVWTGSCPCQPFSSVARGRNTGIKSADHLWPAWRRLVTGCRPRHVFGEQVAHARAWLDQVCDDLEGDGYTVRSAIVPAGAVGADHIRERLWFHSHTDRFGEPGVSVDAEVARLPRRRGEPAGVVSADGVSAAVAQLRAFGNAIVPQAGAAFIRAAMTAERLAA